MNPQQQLLHQAVETQRLLEEKVQREQQDFTLALQLAATEADDSTTTKMMTTMQRATSDGTAATMGVSSSTCGDDNLESSEAHDDVPAISKIIHHAWLADDDSLPPGDMLPPILLLLSHA